MANFQQRKDPVRVMWRRLGAVVLLLLVAVAGRGVWRVYQKEQAARDLRIEAEARLGDLQKREAELRADVAALKSERGVEAELRERYDLAAEGEGVIVIVDSGSPPPPPPPSRYERFKDWLSW